MTLVYERRMLNIPILHIDTNLINARQNLTAVNQLERWYKDEVILINMSSIAHNEAQAGDNKHRTKKASQQIFTASPISTESDPIFKRVKEALFSNGAKGENQLNDVRIVCEAAKYGAIFVTGDGASKSQPGGILGNRDKLRDIVPILSPDEAVSYVRRKIHERDEFNISLVKEFGGNLPPWTGRD